MNRILFASLLTLLVLAAAFWAWTREPSSATVTIPRPNERTDQVARQAETRTLERAQLPESKPPRESGEVIVTGTLVVLDPDGGEYRQESGTIGIIAWDGVGPAPVQKVPVIDGRWSASIV